MFTYYLLHYHQVFSVYKNKYGCFIALLLSLIIVVFLALPAKLLDYATAFIFAHLLRALVLAFRLIF